MGIISKSPHLKSPKGSSSRINAAVGSGSRPVASRHKIKSTSPEDPHGLGRKTKGALS